MTSMVLLKTYGKKHEKKKTVWYFFYTITYSKSTKTIDTEI